jgi:hypothetical protein
LDVVGIKDGNMVHQVLDVLPAGCQPIGQQNAVLIDKRLELERESKITITTVFIYH